MGVEETREALAPAIALAARFLAFSIAGDDGDVHPHQRANVAVGFAVAPQDFNTLPACAERDRDLPHTWILRAGIGVDGFEQPHLGLEARRSERVVVAVEAGIAAAGRFGITAGIVALDGAYRVCRARQCRLRNVGGMGVAHGLVLDRA